MPPGVGITEADQRRSRQMASQHYAGKQESHPRTPSDSEEIIACDGNSNNHAFTSPQKQLQRRKSIKRLAAEALLESRNSSQTDLRDAKRPKRRAVSVPVCTNDACTDTEWCRVPLSIPTIDWPAVLQALASPSHTAPLDTQHHCQLPNGIEVRVVSKPAELGPALSALRDKMEDSVVAIDLEWRPDWAPGSSNKVALMQLSSGTMAVLIRVCKLNCSTLPALLLHFFSDPALTFVSFSWDNSDEGKMQKTFGTGKAAFARLVDLQKIAARLGYHSCGLAALTQRVLGVALPKDKKVTMSNWERHILTPAQVQYAALDALITGHVFRGLRLWHAFPSACSTCYQMFGKVAEEAPSLQCITCTKDFSHLSRLLSHTKATGHEAACDVCTECGRVCPAC